MAEPPADRTPAVRASDAEREAAAARLRDASGEGRLSFEEFTTRLDAAYDATTRGELERLTADLPAPDDRYRAVAPAGGPPARTPLGARVVRSSVAVMSGVDRTGPWRLEGETTAVAVMGGVDLDLRQAQIVGDRVTITAVAIMGGIDIYVPEGVEVEVSGFSLMGGRSVKLADVPRVPGTPIIHVRAWTLMGGIDIRSKPLTEKMREAWRRLHGEPPRELP